MGSIDGGCAKSYKRYFSLLQLLAPSVPVQSGKDRWQGLEQFLLEQHAKKEKRRMVVITGPVFNSGDPSYRNAKMKYAVKCPLQFWKVCVLIKQDDEPSATGFILGQQDITELPGMEAFDVGASQVTIAQLEQKTGLDFGALKTHDHFAQTGVQGELEDYIGGHKQRAIMKPSDIVV